MDSLKSIGEFTSNIISNIKNSNIPLKNKITSSVNSNVYKPTYTSSIDKSIDKSSIYRIAAYVFSILIVTIIIVLFIHFFITPMSNFLPISPGKLGFDDGILFWDKTNSSLIPNKNLPISQIYFNYSLNLDMFIQNQYQFSNYPRILFSRGAEYRDKPTGNTVLGVLSNYNLVIALKSDINDLIVSVLNKDNHMELVIIPNIPIQEPFRVGIVVLELALEVYLNGLLVKTQAFGAPPKDVKGDISPAKGSELNIAKIRNLKIWPRILTTSEIRFAKPGLSSTKQFAPSPIPTTSSCDRSDKLSVDTESILSNISS